MKTNFLCRNVLPRGSCVFLKMVVTITALLCSHLVTYAQPTQVAPADGVNVMTSLELEWTTSSTSSTDIEIYECNSGGTTATDIDLDGYQQLPASKALSVPAGQSAITDLSGVTYSPITGTLFMITNKGPGHSNSDEKAKIYEYSVAGNHIRTIDLVGEDDTEGIAHLYGTTFAIAEEKQGEILFVDIYTNTTSINLTNTNSTALPSWAPTGGDGVEGVTYDPTDGTIHCVTEVPMELHSFNVNTTPTSTLNGTCNLVAPVQNNQRQPNIFGITDLSAIHHLRLTKGLEYLDVDEHILLLSDESNILLEINEDCGVHTDGNNDGYLDAYSQLQLPTVAFGNNTQLEGVTMDDCGNIYVVGEPNHFFVYSNQSLDLNPPGTLEYQTSTFNNPYTVPTSALDADTDYCWRIKNSDECVWSPLWSFTLDACSDTVVQSCDDGNDCTGGDQQVVSNYDGSVCVPCAGTPLVPDCLNLCGVTLLDCDDGDPCTVNDLEVILADGTVCFPCAGGFQDTDSDGVCDADDACPGQDDALIGTACNDGDACTINDIYTPNCECAGTFQDTDADGVCDADDTCPNLPDALIGTACDDGDACTTNDVYTSNCECAGTFQDSDADSVCDADDACPGQNDALIGTACNDGDACTTNDVYTANCECVGTFQDSDGDGVCDADDACPNLDDALIGTPCDDGYACTINDVYIALCGCIGTFQDTDGDSICDAEDSCPNLDNGTIGMPCDDGDDCTIDDVYTANCECAGTIQDTDGDGICDADDTCPTGDNNADADGDGVCDAEDTCPGFDNNLIGTQCDEEDDCVYREYTLENCGCESFEQYNVVVSSPSIIFVESVELNGQLYESGDNGGHLDHFELTGNTFTTLSSTNTITLTPSSNFMLPTPESWSIWIDFNKDLSFEDSEQVYTSLGTDGMTPVTGTFNAPSGIGTTMMRIGVFWSEAVAPCGEFGIAELEDYRVALSPCPDDLTIDQNYVSGSYEAIDFITTDENSELLVDVDEYLMLDAGYSVTLNPGFTAACGSTMRAYIDGCEPFSPKVEQTQVAFASVKPYPNPFRNEVTLEFSLEADAEAQIIISDVNGKTVTQLPAEQLYRGTQTIDISTESWIPGIYFYQVQIREQNTGILSHANGTLVKM